MRLVPIAAAAGAALLAASLHTRPGKLHAAPMPRAPHVAAPTARAAVQAPPPARVATHQKRPTRRDEAYYRAEALDPVYEPALSWFHGCESLDECSLCPPCDPGETCGMDRGLGRRACVASDCASDADCSPGWHCRQLSTDVRRCVESGDRPLGGGCDVDPDWRRLSCAEGLSCVHGRCVE